MICASSGATQRCEFDPGHSINPEPWRIPCHHHAILDYCRRFGVTLEPFIQLNHNAFLHSTTAFDGKPQYIRLIKADFEGGVSELLAKATRKGALDEAVSTEDREILLEASGSPGSTGRGIRDPKDRLDDPPAADQAAVGRGLHVEASNSFGSRARL